MSKNLSKPNAESNILTAIKSHFESLDIKQVVVPEWDNTIIYATPFTMAEKKSLWVYAKGDTLEFTVRALMLKALDKEGKKLFTVADRKTLLHSASSDVIIRVAGELTTTTTIEDQEENL